MALKIKKLLTHLLVGSTIFIGTPVFIESYLIPDKTITRIVRAPMIKDLQYNRYLISTKSGIFANTDSFFYQKPDPLNLQKEIKKLEDKCVEITKYGWTVKSTSEYENIIGIKEVPDSKCPK